MEKKYKLTEETINVNGRTLYRIEALKDFGDVKKGDKGGFVENENNLSQEDNCWVYDNAKVIGNATVESSAVILDNAIISDSAKVYGRAKVYGNAQVYGNSVVCDYVEVYDDAKIYEHAFVCGLTEVYENAIVYGNVEIYENSVVRGECRVNGVAEICDAIITSNLDYMVFKNWWSSGRYFTWTRSNDMWKVGCFYGTGKELIEKAYKDSELSGREYERVVKYVESILKNS